MADVDVDVNQTTGDTFSKTQIAFSGTQPQITEFTNHSAFYAVYPSYYFTFGYQWLRRWLAWFDGFVPGVHGGGMLSTRLATTLCYRIAEQVFGGGLLFAKKNNSAEAEKAVKFVSGDWNDKSDFDNQILKTFVLASAGGTAYTKLNVDKDNQAWIDSWRADQCWVDIDFRGKAKRAKFIIANYTKIVPGDKEQNEKNYYLVEERFIATKKDIKEFAKSHEEAIRQLRAFPLKEGESYTKFNVYELTGTVNNYTQGTNESQKRTWSELPEDIKKSIIDAYGTVKLDEPKKLPFIDLGVDIFKWTSFISNLPQLPYGESLIAKIQTYLWEYDYMNSCMNTDFYLGRGRVLVPKQLQSPKVATSPNSNQGLDNFLFTKVEYSTIEDKKPESIQFELRSQEWINSRNNLLESMATAIGISPSTIASYLNDSSARTAREISSEESATALFIENRRKLFSKPLNDLIKRILLFYELGDNVEVKFSQSGQTNTTLVVENTTAKFNAGLMSKYQAVKTLNPDFSEEEIQAELKRINDEQDEAQQKNNDLFGQGGFDEKLGEFEGGGADEDSEGQPELASPTAPGSEDTDKASD